MNNKIKNYGTLAIVYIAAGILVIQVFATSSELTLYHVTGLLIILPSLLFFTIARVQLGRSFQVSATAIKLVTGGIYKKIRHPVYFFGTLLLLGFIIFIQKYLLLILWIGIIVMQIIRIKKEERVLQEKFGERYKEYKKSTWF